MKTDDQFFIVFCLSSVLLLWEVFDGNEAESFSVPNLIRERGYPAENHEVTTKDGYILNIYRIPFGKNIKMAKRKPIILMHGLMGHSDQFLINDHINGSLAFLLADEGFDVWLGNVRGSISGERHINLDPSSKAFWDFSHHEMGLYDLPCQIDYILETTGYDDLQFVGFSQGGRIFFITTTMNPEYQKKISLASLMAPSGYNTYFSSWWLRPMALRTNELTYFLNILNIRRFPPKILKLGDAGAFICRNILTRRLCFALYKLLVGDSGEVTIGSVALLAQYSYHMSSKQLLHFGQTILSGHFRPWDYGAEGNLEVYGQVIPSDYAIENISVPIAMYYSLSDSFSDFRDVEKLCQTVQKCVRKLLMKNQKWTHVDYIISKNAGRELNIPLLEFARDFQKP